MLWDEDEDEETEGFILAAGSMEAEAFIAAAGFIDARGDIPLAGFKDEAQFIAAVCPMAPKLLDIVGSNIASL